MRAIGRLLVLFALALVAGCGGDDEAAEPEDTAAAGSGWLQSAPPGSLNARLAAKPGEDGAFILGSSDFAVGDVRVAFLVVRSNGRVVERPSARVRVARAPNARPQVTVEATLEQVGVGPGSTTPEAPDALYVARFRADEPGRYSLLAEPNGASIQAFGDIEVLAESKSLGLGDRAFPSENPTLDDAPAEQISTGRPPTEALLQSSIREAMRARDPFVVAFATPKFCQTRTCGPTVEVVDAVRQRVARPRIHWIHVEVYEGNDPNRGVNRWMREWRLPSEPWVFVVDGEGIIRAKFEGFVSVDELETAVRRYAR
jgi:hypothetical protein